jgi:(5-formylfuran-3-yl)methyl phosphate synthase
MQLLVSVSDAAEALAAVSGGADIIDAKNPSMGALGAVRPDVLSEIRRAVDPGRLVTAALGDADAAKAVEELARELAVRGARLVKVGFGDIADAARVEEIIGRLTGACSSLDEPSGVVAVAYADAQAGTRIDAHELLPIAARSGASGVLVDTADKRGPGLLNLWNTLTLESWIAEAHAHGLMAAVAGKLRLDDLGVVADAGADVAGVRGAACVGGRAGRVSSERVRSLAARVALQRSTT